MTMMTEDGRYSGMKSILRSVTVLLAFIMAVTPVLGGVGGVSFAEDKVKYTFGRCEVCSTFGSEMLSDSFYCSDSWFEEEPEKENDELALLSMQAVSSFMDDKDDGSGNVSCIFLGINYPHSA